MISQPRTPTKDLLIMRLLNARMNFSSEDKLYYSRIEKGFQGELQFDSLSDKLKSDCIVKKGLLLEVHNSEFQIDSLIMFRKLIFLLDIKNYEGDYYCEENKLFFANGNIVKDPLPQLMRCESLFLQLMQKLGYHFPVVSHLVFVNPEFTLMQAPKDYPIIYPTQLNRFMKKLNCIPANLTGMHEAFAKQLQSLHKKESKNRRIPEYHYQQCKKGIICENCQSLLTNVEGNFVICMKCGHREEVDSAVLRSVDELKLLFPEERITTAKVHDWCSIVKSRKTIRRILLQNLNSVGKTKVRYFISK
ncbi:nuclease-related domain-containing protein [Bacillus rubiinfantis]|uniref:nuclease-related domain-containing protein n=1 Tax=Bacillus rubiinfantis TaxID=1499680 RepID=UPI0005AA713A|nr:nuclease-related domain-containing protein [Bacillus rubiinfantis]